MTQHTELFNRFIASIARADRNVLIMFGGTLLAVAAWYSINLLPVKWQPSARNIAWMYTVLFLTITVVYSI